MEKLFQDYLNSSRKLFAYYKQLGDLSIAQLTNDEQIHWQLTPSTNSIAIIVKHMSGNMRSRWTNFLSEDGEKPWRNREAEFQHESKSKAEMLEDWESGWACFFEAMNSLNVEDLGRIIYIRNEGHTVLEAINRQLAHYPHHVGQIVHIAKSLAGENWHSLSIPKGDSAKFNADKFEQEKGRRHFV